MDDHEDTHEQQYPKLEPVQITVHLRWQEREGFPNYIFLTAGRLVAGAVDPTKNGRWRRRLVDRFDVVELEWHTIVDTQEEAMRELVDLVVECLSKNEDTPHTDALP